MVTSLSLSPSHMYQSILSITIPWQPWGTFDQNFSLKAVIWLGQGIWPNEKLIAVAN